MFLLLIGWSQGLTAQPSISFQKQIYLTGHETVQDIRQTADSGYVLIGTAGNPCCRVFVMKLNFVGDTVWTRSFRSTYESENGTIIYPTIDGGYFLTSSYEYQTIAVKLDSFGLPVSSTVYDNIIKGCAPFPEISGYVCTGWKEWYSFRFVLDSNTDSIWSKRITGTPECSGYAVERTSDGGFIVLASESRLIRRNPWSFPVLIRTDSLGNTIWVRQFEGRLGNAFTYDVQTTRDGGFILAGAFPDSTTPFDGSNGSGLVKVDSLGNTVWQGGDNSAQSVREATDGGYVYLGSSDLVKVDSAGNELWRFHTPINSQNAVVRRTTDGGYVVAGNYWRTGCRNSIYILKTDAEGHTDSTITYIGSCPGDGGGGGGDDDGGGGGGGGDDTTTTAPTLPKEFALAQNFPNPFNPITTIAYALPQDVHVTLSIVDVLGRVVTTLVDEQKQPGSYEAVWSAEGVPSGVYFYRMQVRRTVGGQGGSFVEAKKLVVIR
jgi:hypothetical protein